VHWAPSHTTLPAHQAFDERGELPALCGGQHPILHKLPAPQPQTQRDLARHENPTPLSTPQPEQGEGGIGGGGR